MNNGSSTADLSPDESGTSLPEQSLIAAVQELDRALEGNPQQIGPWREKARLFMDHNREDDAIACYDRMIEIEPRNSSLYLEKAAALEAMYRDEDALKVYEGALDIAPKDNGIMKLKAQLLTSLQRITEAVAIYDTILQSTPRDTQILVGRGDALLAAGDIVGARTCFEQAAAISPESFGAAEWTNHAAELGLDHAEDAIQFCDKAIAADNRYAWAYREKALVLGARPETRAEALRLLDIAISLEPSAWFWVEKGNIYYNELNYKSAAECYQRAVEIDPKYLLGWKNLNTAQVELELYQEGLASSEKAIALDPECMDCWVQKGFCLGKLNRLDEAITCYRNALDLDADDFLANNNLGWTLSATGRDQEALPYLRRAIEVDPSNPMPWSNLATSLVNLERYQEAIDRLQSGLESVSDKRDLVAQLGVIYSDYVLDQGKALEYHQQWIRLAPDDFWAHLNLAECLVIMNKTSEARETLTRLVDDNRAEVPMVRSILMMACCAMDGDIQGRSREFEAFTNLFEKVSAEGKGPKESWNFRGLSNKIRACKMGVESKFLLSAAIDMHQGRLTPSILSYFHPASQKQTAGRSSRAQAQETVPGAAVLPSAEMGELSNG